MRSKLVARRRDLFLVICFLIVVWVGVCKGDIIVAEEFEYESTLIRGCNGGLGWAGPWTGANLITPGSLRYGAHAAKGNKLTTNGGNTASDAIRCSFRTIGVVGHEELTENGEFGKPGSTLWIGFLIHAPTGESTGFAGVSLCEGNREQMFFGDAGASNVWAFERKGEVLSFSSVLADDKVAFIVARIQFKRGEAYVEMWLNPKPGEKQPSSSEVAIAETVSEFHFNRVRLASAPVPISFDSLRMGTTYADIAPVGSN